MFSRYLINFKKKDIKTETKDVVVVGAGLAGLLAGLEVREDNEVAIIAKGSLEDSNTEQAQGGIAAAICEKDSTSLHTQDTISAGHGLCDERVVDEVVSKGPKAIESLLYYGVPFDKQGDQLALTREGAHSRRRVLHASGDGTGRVMRQTLVHRVKEKENITLLENTFVIDIYTENNQAKGVFIQNEGKISLILAKYVVLASGGAGQLYKYTTNPQVATGDGIAMAYRAKANVRDLEFVQFHPTAIVTKNAPRFLVSEAVRGEGGILLNMERFPFMEQYHEKKELAPRDVVARAMQDQMEKSKSEFLYLDVSHMTKKQMELRFPNIYKTCHKYGIKVPKDLIPVAPAAHYTMGGVTVDTQGRTNISNLLACGEVTCSGLHGANRLASNSLLEALVYGQNIAEYINDNIQFITLQHNINYSGSSVFNGEIEAKNLVVKLQDLMWENAGLKREEKGLKQLIVEITHLLRSVKEPSDIEDYEAINMLQVSLLLVKGALERKESRGGHFRLDYPKPKKVWKKHVNFNIENDMWCSEIQ